MDPSPSPPRRSLTRQIAGFIGQQLGNHTARRLRRLGPGLAAQDEVFCTLTTSLAGTDFGRTNGLEGGLAYADFHRRLIPRTYEDFAPSIERMKQGQSNVLCPGRCEHFAVSSGTTAGPSKWLPVNAPLLDHFRDAGLDSLLFYARRTGRGTVFRGRHLFLGGSSTLVPLPGITPPIYSGDLSGITALKMPAWVARYLYEPGLEIAQLADWPAKLTAIAQRTRQADITLVAGIPSWLLVLAATLRAHEQNETGRVLPDLQALWPNLECLVHGGVPVAPFTDELRAAYGPGICFHEVYPASEAFIAVQDDAPEAGLRLLVDRGVFFEFLPVAAYDAANPERSAAHVLPLSGVQPGLDYVLLLTTPAGLVRYVIGDVVRFISINPPRLVYTGRTKLQLSAFGEHVIEKELTDSLTAVCRQQQQTLVNFHVAPLFPDPGAGRLTGCHEWWIELRPSPVQVSPDTFATALDRELAHRNDDYAAKRTGHGLTAPAVRLLAPGHFERWLRQAGKWGGQSKTPRCRSDRQVAEALAAFK